MVIKLQEKEGIQIARFAELSRFTLAVIEKVKHELKPILIQENTKMILDMKDINFIDSSGIGCIISLVKVAKNNGSALILCNLNKDVADIIDLLHLHMILDIQPDLPSALKRLEK